METKTKNTFKAVDFMRQVRNELSELYHTDKERYHKELKKTMTDFLSARTKSAANIGIATSGAER
jgi:hypothetical protein